MSRNALERVRLSAVPFSLFLVLLLVTPLAFAGNASCSISGGTIVCGGVFTTSGQSMFGLGQGTYIYNNTFGTSWNASGSVGGIYDAGIFGQWGGELRGSTSGNLGLSVDFRASAGTVSATVPAGVTLSMDTSHAYRPGELVTISSTYNAQSLTASNFGFTTVSPNVGASAQVGFRLQASAGATVCVYDCTGFNLPIDTGQQTIPIFSYNEALYGTSASQIQTDNSGLKLFGVAVGQPTFSGDVGKLIGLPADTWTATVDLSADATVVNTTGTYGGTGRTVTSSATATNNILSTQLDVAKLLTDVDGIGVSSGTLGDLMPQQTPELFKNLGDKVGYTLAKVDVGAGLSLGQNFAMSAPTGATISLDISSGGTRLDTLTFNAGDSVSFRMPDATCAGPTCTAGAPLTITPTISVNPVGFTSTTTLNPELNVGLKALELSLFGLDTGYIVDWNKSLPLGSVSLFTKDIGLGGFNTLTSSQGFTLNTTLDPSGTPMIDYDFWNKKETVYYSYKDVGASGIVLDPIQGSTLRLETLVGSVMRPQDGLERSVIGGWGGGTLLVLDKSSTVTKMDIKDNGWIRGDWTIQSQTGRNVLDQVNGSNLFHLMLETQSGGTLVLKDSSLADLKQIGGSGTLTLDHSNVGLNRFGNQNAETLNAEVILQNGSRLSADADFIINTSKTMQVTGESTFYSERNITAGAGATAGIGIEVGTGSLLQTGKTSILDAGAVGGKLNISGTVQLGGMTNVNAVVNAGGLLLFPARDWGFQVTNGSVTLKGGSMELSFGDFNAPITGMGYVRVTSVVSASTILDQNVVLEAGSRLDVEGQLLARKQLQADVANVSGSLTANGLTLGSLQIEKQGHVNLSGTSTVGELRNQGDLEVRSGTLISPKAIVNAGEFYLRDTLIVAPWVENVGGAFGAEGKITLTGNYIQHDGRTVIGGATFTTPRMVIEGGTVLAGKSVIDGSVVNGGAFRMMETTTINGDYSQSANGVLEFAFHDAQDFDQLLVNGDVTLDGILRLDVSADMFGALTLGDTFDFLRLGSGTLTGTFSQVLFDYGGGTLPFGYGWELIYGSSGASLMWTRAQDYGAWAIAVKDGTTIPTAFADLQGQGLSPELMAWLENNKGADPADMLNVNVGSTDFVPTQLDVANLQVRTVPEPASWVMLGVGLVVMARSVRRRAR